MDGDRVKSDDGLALPCFLACCLSRSGRYASAFCICFRQYISCVRKVLDFIMKDVELLLEEFRGLYEERILIRVLETMGQQMRKYAYLF